jgi:hypothetical protein
LSCSLSRIRVTAALAVVAIIVAGCAGANNAASNQGEQSYQTGYGLSSAGTTTSLYSELFGSGKPAEAPAAVTAAAEPVQPASGTAAPQTAQPANAVTASRGSRPAAASVVSRQVQPAPAPTEVAQQPAAPRTAPEPDVPVAFGLTANGPTTDLYTELFGPRRRDGQ